MTSPVQPSEEPLKLLFVKLKHIGDALLLTPTLIAARQQYPNAEIWVVVRKGTEGILAGCPAIDHVVTVTPVELAQRSILDFWKDIQTGWKLRGRHFDYAFDLSDGDRGRWLVGLSRAKQRCISTTKKPIIQWWQLWINRQTSTLWTKGHRVEKDHQMVSEFLPLAAEVPPLSFEKARTQTPSPMEGVSDFVVIHPGSRWKKKRWPFGHWLKLSQTLLEHTNTLVISSGPAEDERKLARKLTAQLGPNRVVNSDGQWTWAELAGCLRWARAYVGLDTAATHLAAACRCPIVALYALTLVDHWKPWRAECRLFHPLQWLNSWEEVLGFPPSEIMASHQPDKVLAAVLEIIREPVSTQSK